MVTTKILATRCFRKYKICFVLGIVTVLFQIYLAIQFISLSSDTHSNTKWNPHKSKGDSDNNINSARKIKYGLIDDEETPNEQKQKDQGNGNTSSKTIPRLRLEELDFKPACEINIKEAISAIHRAKTQKCKQLIANITCLEKEKLLYPKSLPHYCPTDGFMKNKALGCFKDEKNSRLLDGFFAKFNNNSPKFCIEICLQSGFPYAGLQYSNECFCGSVKPPSIAKIADSSCNMKCSGSSIEICGGYYTMNIFETGVARPMSQEVVTENHEKIKKVKVVFLLTLNGRALRQVKRLIKILANKNVFFYIHVDVRQDYLFRELLILENKFPEVVKLTRTRFSTIWGGASLLTMLLSCMKELLNSEWQWDFVINLSESDYPVKTIDKLIDFLSANPRQNFVKSHGRETQRFIQKQGLDKTFVECDHHMWRVGDRKLPEGIVISGGSDWVALSREFVSYVLRETPSDLVTGLLQVFRYTLLPAESFFHTVLKNSEFCDRTVDNNLHVTNWKRKLGCKCQYKHIVDWCGCSPNDFKPEDWSRIQNTENKQIFFARKFEPVVNQAVILQLERWLLGPTFIQVPNVDSYWQSVYHHQDLNPVDDVLITLSFSVIRLMGKQFSEEQKCNLIPSKILEVSTYHFEDTYKNNLVKFTATTSDLIYELSFKPRNLFSIQKLTSFSKRLKYLIVSSDFDPKERISRNFARTLGPYSEPLLIYNFEADGKFKEKTSNISFIWLNPAGEIEEVNNIQIDENLTIESVKPSLKQPLLPGFWTTYLIHKREVLAQVKFLILPLKFVSGNPIEQHQVKIFHSGSGGITRDFVSLWDDFRPNLTERESLKRISLANSKRFGDDLDNWIDSLVSKSYKVQKLCIEKATNNSCFEKVQICNQTAWSSLTEDLKSTISKYNSIVGKFEP